MLFIILRRLSHRQPLTLRNWGMVSTCKMSQQDGIYVVYLRYILFEGPCDPKSFSFFVNNSVIKSTCRDKSEVLALDNLDILLHFCLGTAWKFHLPAKFYCWSSDCHCRDTKRKYKIAVRKLRKPMTSSRGKQLTRRLIPKKLFELIKF